MASYADITSLIAPSEAYYGSRVDIGVTIKNIYSSPISVMFYAELEYGVSPRPAVTYSYNSVTLNAGASHTFPAYFTMPNKSVKIYAYSYYYGSDGQWHGDDQMTKNVSLKELEPTFDNFGVKDYSKA